MKWYQDSFVQIVFGNRSTALDPALVRGKKSSEIVFQEPFLTFQKEFSVSPDAYVFLHQTHGVEGVVLKKENFNIPVFAQDGDYLLTTVPGIGIGVATADCLAIVLIDPVKKAVGVVHAGWKGLVTGVVEEAVDRMQLEYGSVFTDITFIFGPSAHSCCYEVGKDFFDQARTLRPSIERFLNASLLEREGRFFFESILFFKLIFFEKGFVESDFDFSNAECTICKPVYCSYRREKMSPLRQLTIVSLK